MRAVPIASFALLLAVSCGWISPSLSQTPPSVPGGTPGVGVPGVKVPSIPGVQQPAVPGLQSPPGTGGAPGAAGAAGAGASVTKGQDTQWAGKRCLNRGDNNMGTCQDVCKNLGVTRASDSREYSGICNY
jgi:hypothetical protein